MRSDNERSFVELDQTCDEQPLTGVELVADDVSRSDHAANASRRSVFVKIKA